MIEIKEEMKAGKMEIVIMALEIKLLIKVVMVEDMYIKSLDTGEDKQAK